MNLWGIENAKKRRDLAWSLRKTIQQKWVEMYATEPVDEVKAIEVAAGGVEDLIPELKADGISRCTMELVPEGDLVKLTILHEMEKDESKLIDAVSKGWPKILSSLKTLLETGEPLAA